MELFGILVVCLVCGVIAAIIGDRKNLGGASSFFLGAILGIIGIIIVVCQKPGLPRAPTGMQAVQCPRCNAVQNIEQDAVAFECWQCHKDVRWGVPPNARREVRQTENSDSAVALPTRIACYKCKHILEVPPTQMNFVCDACGTQLKRKVKL
jgi:predicted RNA-binding Zn-ribbon protein involved in translation (DUF1610 family)